MRAGAPPQDSPVARPARQNRIQTPADKIVLLAADGASNTAIAAKVSTGKHMVGKWRERFARLRTDGLLDEPRSGAPRRIGDEQVAELIDRTLSERPQGATHWSRRSMAKAQRGVGYDGRRVWRAFGLQPHRSETFKLPTDPLFAEKVRDIVRVYLAPPTRALVLCAWTRSPRSRRSTARSRCCHSDPDRRSGAPTTMPGTAPPVCLPRST